MDTQGFRPSDSLTSLSVPILDSCQFMPCRIWPLKGIHLAPFAPKLSFLFAQNNIKILSLLSKAYLYWPLDSFSILCIFVFQLQDRHINVTSLNNSTYGPTVSPDLSLIPRLIQLFHCAVLRLLQLTGESGISQLCFMDCGSEKGLLWFSTFTNILLTYYISLLESHIIYWSVRGTEKTIVNKCF